MPDEKKVKEIYEQIISMYKESLRIDNDEVANSALLAAAFIIAALKD